MTYAIYSYDERRNYTGLQRREDELAARWYALGESKKPGNRRSQYVVHRFDYDTNGWVLVGAYRDGLEMSDPHVIVTVKAGQVWRSRTDGSRFKVTSLDTTPGKERVRGAYPDGKRPRSIGLKRFTAGGKHGYELEVGV